MISPVTGEFGHLNWVGDGSIVSNVYCLALAAFTMMMVAEKVQWKMGAGFGYLLYRG